MLCELDKVFWDDLLNRIQEGEVIPMVGPGAITFGSSDQLLYPDLAGKLVVELKLSSTFKAPPSDFHAVVDAQRAAKKPIERIYRHINELLKDRLLRPGPTLERLADIEAFNLFLTTTFDPLLARAVESRSHGGRPEERRGAISLRSPSPDIPGHCDELANRFVYHLFGCAQPMRDFVIWDDDTLHFLLQLDQLLPQKPLLSEALINKHLLVLGLRLDHLLLRFFVQIIKRKRLSDLAGSELFIAENLQRAERDQVVVYFDRFTDQIRVIPGSPRAFIRLLHRKWRKTHPRPAQDSFAMSKAHREKHRACGTVFVSYASPDEAIARYVVNQLQQAGLHVWFDQEQILPGQDWQEVLREAVDERCGLFISLISYETATRLTGWNVFERNLAARRRDRFADDAVFYLPVRIDGGDLLIPDNEPRGIRRIQAVRKPGGHFDEAFIAYLRELQEEYVKRRCPPHVPDAPTS